MCFIYTSGVLVSVADSATATHMGKRGWSMRVAACGAAGDIKRAEVVAKSALLAVLVAQVGTGTLLCTFVLCTSSYIAPS
jgi:hypothetical protein